MRVSELLFFYSLKIFIKPSKIQYKSMEFKFPYSGKKIDTNEAPAKKLIAPVNAGFKTIFSLLSLITVLFISLRIYLPKNKAVIKESIKI